MHHRKRETLIFWGATALALAFYALTAPDGLPWTPDAPDLFWTWLVARTGGSAVLPTSVLTALAAGCLGSALDRFLGWRVGVAAALAWMTSPWVWNQAIIGARAVFIAAGVIVAVWLVYAYIMQVSRRARRTQFSQRYKRETNHALAMPTHRERVKGHRRKRLLGRLVLAPAAIFAAVSVACHDSRYGEAASVFAKLVVDEADDRTVVLNGVADAQIVRELGRRLLSGRGHVSALSLLNTEAARSNLVARTRREFPSETNLWMAALIGPSAFADAAVRSHPDRFHVQTGFSTTPERWVARWKAVTPYLGSDDPFIPVMRRAFAFEGNALGNALRSDESLSKRAWHAYWRVFDEVDPENPAACVNLNAMLRDGYPAGEKERRRIARTRFLLTDLPEDEHLALEMALQLAAFGPVIRDERDYEELRARAASRLARLSRSGLLFEAPDLRTIEEWHAEMMKAYDGKDLDGAATIARSILSRPRWRGFVPAHRVLGAALAAQGDEAAAEAFYRTARMGKDRAAVY